MEVLTFFLPELPETQSTLRSVVCKQHLDTAFPKGPEAWWNDGEKTTAQHALWGKGRARNPEKGLLRGVLPGTVVECEAWLLSGTIHAMLCQSGQNCDQDQRGLYWGVPSEERNAPCPALSQRETEGQSCCRYMNPSMLAIGVATGNQESLRHSPRGVTASLGLVRAPAGNWLLPPL